MPKPEHHAWIRAISPVDPEAFHPPASSKEAATASVRGGARFILRLTVANTSKSTMKLSGTHLDTSREMAFDTAPPAQIGPSSKAEFAIGMPVGDAAGAMGSATYIVSGGSETGTALSCNWKCMKDDSWSGTCVGDALENGGGFHLKEAADQIIFIYYRKDPVVPNAGPAAPDPDADPPDDPPSDPDTPSPEVPSPAAPAAPAPKQPVAPAATEVGQKMRPDCKVVHGRVPGPANLVLCATHGHILDTDKKIIVAHDLAAFVAQHPEYARLPSPMLPDCQIVRGKVPGPKHHVLCGKHGHVLDEDRKQIIAHTLEEYERRH